MKQKSEHNIKRSITNIFGALGYLFCLLQWFWAIILYFSVIQSIALFVSSDAGKPVEHTSVFTFAVPDPLKWIILIAVTAIVLALTIYIFVKVPMDIMKTSHKVVYKTAEAMAPIVIKAQHKKDTKTFRIKITAGLILAIKLLLVIVPVVLTLASGLLDEQYIDYSIATIVAYGLASLSAGLFVIQYLLSTLLRVKIQNLW